MMTILRKIGILVTGLAIGLGWYYSINIFPNCHSRINPATKYMATKSPYLDEHITESTSTVLPGDCTAQQVWMLVRHGTRNPSADVIARLKKILPLIRDEIILNHEKGTGQICDDEISHLKTWLPFLDLEESDEKMLVPQGVREMAGIATRFRERFPALFSSKYSNATYKFKYTKTSRAKSSAEAFAESLFGDGHRGIRYPEALSADPILRFYKDCLNWKHNVNKNPEAYKEQKLFEVSPPFQQMRERVTTRLGFKTLLSNDHLVTMYLGCSFETAWEPSLQSPWCSTFSEEDFKVLEYHQDLDYYWIDGYGYEINYKQACPAVNDLINHFGTRIEHPTESPNVIAYFTHSGTSLKLITRLGFFNDTIPLRSDNFHSQVNRKWKTSQIDKFATNLAVILYKCGNGEYRIGMMFQELPIRLPYCKNQFHCPFEEFRMRMKEIIGDCNKDQMCQLLQ